MQASFLACSGVSGRSPLRSFRQSVMKRLRSLALWESQEPVPDPREQPGPDGVDARYARSARG